MLSRLAVVLILWISLLTGISRADDEVAFEVIHEVSFRVTTQTFTSDHENRLIVVVDRLTGSFSYSYVHRPSGVLPNEAGSRGVPLVVAKLNLGGWGIINGCEGSATNPAVETMRGSDMGGGVGGVLYTRLENGQISFNHYNSRGDLTAQTTGLGSVSWAASYRGDGTRSAEVGNAIGRQRANTKDEDPTGLLNEGMRYRDLEFGIFLTRDPAGFVDGPNVYTYVRQNPWTMFDPYGLNAFADYMGDVGMTVKGVGVGFSKTAWSSVTGFGKLAWRNNPLVNLGQLVKGSKTGYQSNWEDGKAALGVGYDLATSSEARAAAGQAVDDYLYEATKSPGKMGEMLIGPGLAFAVEAAVGAKGLDKLAKLNAVDDGLGALSKVDEALGVTTARETVEVVEAIPKPSEIWQGNCFGLYDVKTL
ncbi:MAG: hypothetical protein MUF31_17995 [Akkermansiaceae bacterium]|nr:hypothetical protein [Akkermansiaceae bacterium]